jgi:hypothetical protein
MTGQFSISLTQEDIQAIAAEVVRQMKAQPVATSNATPALWITDKEVAARLSIHQQSVRKLCGKGTKFGGNTRWKVSDIEQLMSKEAV